MSPFLYNLLLFSPLLLVAAGFLYILERLDAHRRSPTPPPEPEPGEAAEPEEQLQPPEPEAPNPDPYPPQDAGESSSESEIDENAPPPHPPPPPPPLLPPNDADPAVAAGAGGTVAPLRTPQTRQIGPKKMRSLARRDQRRAYHEFLRSQAEARSEAEAALQEEEAERAFENARRRYLAEEEIAVRRRSERAARLELERCKEAAEAQAADAVVAELRLRIRLGQDRGRPVVVHLDELARKVGRDGEKVWVEGVLRRQGFLSPGEGGEVRMVTREGVWVGIHPEAVGQFWRVVQTRGKMEWQEVRDVLEGLLVGEVNENDNATSI